MAAVVGYVVNELGITFPGDVASGVPFSSLGKGVDAWVNLPNWGKAQIVLFIGILELGGEAKKPHYLKGGDIGYTPGPFGFGKLWDPVGTVPKEEDKLEVLRNKELANGRLAMISIISFLSAAYIPGSVPLVPSGW